MRKHQKLWSLSHFFFCKPFFWIFSLTAVFTRCQGRNVWVVVPNTSPKLEVLLQNLRLNKCPKRSRWRHHGKRGPVHSCHAGELDAVVHISFLYFACRLGFALNVCGKSNCKCKFCVIKVTFGSFSWLLQVVFDGFIHFVAFLLGFRAVFPPAWHPHL